MAVKNGGIDLNELLYLKDTYAKATADHNTGLQKFASSKAAQLYGGAADKSLADQFRGMDSAGLRSYMNGGKPANGNTGIAGTGTAVAEKPKTGMMAGVSDLKAFGASHPAPQAQPAASATTPGATLRFSNDYTEQAGKLMTQLEQLMNQPTSYTQQDLEADPTFQAATKLAAEKGKLATHNTLETMNDRGIINSSITAGQLGEIEQQAQLKPLELVPQLQANALNQRQSKISNLAGLASAYLGAGQNERNFQAQLPIQEAAVTGRYVPGDVRGVIDELVSLKRQAESPDITREQRSVLHERAEALRDKLVTAGVDPSQFGANVTSDKAAANFGNLGQLTVDSQKSLIDLLSGLSGAYGSLPKGASGLIGGLPMFQGLESIYKGLEGKKTLPASAQEFNQMFNKEQLASSNANAAASRAISSRNADIAERNASQRETEYSDEKDRLEDERRAKQSTQNYIARLSNEPNREAALQYIANYGEAIVADNANITEIYKALDTLFPPASSNPQPPADENPFENIGK